MKKNNNEIPSYIKNDLLPCCTYNTPANVNLEKMACTATKNGHLECLKYAHINRCSWGERICEIVAAHEMVVNGQLNNWSIRVFEICPRNGCEWGDTCEIAAVYGYLDCLNYVQENGCLWNDDTCDSAIMKGKLECLKYAHKNGCLLSEQSCYIAAEYGHLECLNVLMRIIVNGKKNCVVWRLKMVV